MLQRWAVIFMLVGAIAGYSQAGQTRMRDLFGMPGSEVRPDRLVDRREAPKMTPAEAARAAQKRYGGGKVLSVDPENDGYRVKLLRDGDVRVVFIAGH